MLRFSFLFLFIVGGQMGLVSELIDPDVFYTGQKSRGCGAYAPVADEQLYNEVFVDSAGEAAQLVNNAKLLYAQTRRVQQTMISHFDTDSTGLDMVLTVPVNGTRSIYTTIGKGMLTGAGRHVKAWIYFKTDAAETTHLHMTCGRHHAVSEDIENVAFGWISVECAQDQVESVTLDEQRYLRLYAEAGGVEVELTIRSISIFELGDPAAPDYIDTSGADNQLGQADWPYSAAMTHVLNNNIKACYGWRMPRANLLNHCMMSPAKAVTGAYDGDVRGLGMYVIRKSKGETAINLQYLAYKVGSGTATITFRIYTMAGAPVVNTSSSTLTTSAAWYTTPLIGGLDADETEYELRIDAKETIASVTSVSLINVFAVDPLDGAGSYVSDQPSKSLVQSEDDILAKPWPAVRDMLEHVWKRPRQILLNDHRVTQSARDGNFFEHLTSGVVFPTFDSRFMHFRLYLLKPAVEGTGMLDYDAEAGAGLVRGEVVRDTTPGASAYLAYKVDGGATGTLYLRDIDGTFHDNSPLTSASGGTANANGIVERITGQEVKVKITMQIDGVVLLGYADTTIQELEIDVTDRDGDRIFVVDLRMFVPTYYWDDHSVSSITPLMFGINTRSLIDSVVVTGGLLTDGNAIDYVKLIQSQVFEEI